MTKPCTDRQHQGARELSTSEFYRNPLTLDGLGSSCKTCVKAAVLKTRDARQAAGLTRTTLTHKARSQRPSQPDAIWLQENR